MAGEQDHVILQEKMQVHIMLPPGMLIEDNIANDKNIQEFAR